MEPVGADVGGEGRPAALKVGQAGPVEPPAVQHRVIDLVEVLLTIQPTNNA